MFNGNLTFYIKTHQDEIADGNIESLIDFENGWTLTDLDYDYVIDFYRTCLDLSLEIEDMTTVNEYIRCMEYIRRHGVAESKELIQATAYSFCESVMFLIYHYYDEDKHIIDFIEKTILRADDLVALNLIRTYVLLNTALTH